MPKDKRRRSTSPPSPIASSSAASAAKKTKTTPPVLDRVLTRNQLELEAIVKALPKEVIHNLVKIIYEYHCCEQAAWFNTADTILANPDAYGKFDARASAEFLWKNLKFSVKSPNFDAQWSYMDVVATTARKSGRTERLSEILYHMQIAAESGFNVFAEELKETFDSNFNKPRVFLDALSAVSRIQAMVMLQPSTTDMQSLTATPEGPFPFVVDPEASVRSEQVSLVREVIYRLGTLMLEYPTRIKHPNRESIDCYWVLFAFASLIRGKPLASIEALAIECYDVVAVNPDLFENVSSIVSEFTESPTFMGKPILYRSSLAHPEPPVQADDDEEETPMFDDSDVTAHDL